MSSSQWPGRELFSLSRALLALPPLTSDAPTPTLLPPSPSQIHVIDGSSPQPYLELQAVTRELALFSPSLAAKPRVIVFNKMDLPDAQHQWGSFQEAVRELGLGGEGEEDGVWWGGAEGEGEGEEEGEGRRGPVVLSMSAVTGQGTQEVVRAAYDLLKRVQGESDGWGDEEEEEAPNTTRQRLGLAAEVQRARRAAVNEFRVAFDSLRWALSK
ncbi:unnamed protein product [Closterium sp. NIES-53]